MSRPVEGENDNARWSPGRHQLRQGYLELLEGKEIRHAHKGLFTD